MKKSTILTIVAVVVIAIGGGVFYATQKANHNQVDASYNDAMTSGKKAVADKDYKRASSAFEKALGIKQTDQAKAYKDQSDNMLVAITATKAGKYDRALNRVDGVIKQNAGYGVLVKQGKQLKETIEDVQDNYDHEITPIFTAAEEAESNQQYVTAVEQYQRVLDLPYINGQYYSKYKERAQKGIKRDKKAAKNNNGTAAVPYGSKSSRANKHDTGNAGKTGEGAMGNHKVHGKTVTNKQIDQLRKRVGQLGYEASSWSPQDLIDLYRNSGQNRPSKITSQDVQNYLKP
ncbi:hypothetical protein [Lactobacillus xylocopicola]|uniref:Lipoprotein n=1 Tax=Lactobacillus xylocopicola TaxID=2976676 RepID=A0ABM8BII0_9LACO|nr:hypothetical protein [Lactobacillus xylocopicola]BDR61105.1 hypothetical protein KIM322_13660 [Lactobacillus xylocopicola]